MNQIIGNFKEFVIIERKELEEIEKQALNKLQNNKERPLSESSIKARSVLNVINLIKEKNVYNQDFKIKG